MEVEFDVKLNRSAIQDYMLHNGRIGTIRIVLTVLGTLLIVGFFLTARISMVYFGLVAILYLPVFTWFRARRLSKMDRFLSSNFFLLNDSGITKVSGSETKRVEWENVAQAISTRKCIIVFTDEQKACVFPRVDMGDKTEAVIKIISTHLEPEKNKIRA